jgi:hypothetical protein
MLRPTAGPTGVNSLSQPESHRQTVPYGATDRRQRLLSMSAELRAGRVCRRRVEGCSAEPFVPRINGARWLTVTVPLPVTCLFDSARPLIPSAGVGGLPAPLGPC